MRGGRGYMEVKAYRPEELEKKRAIKEKLEKGLFIFLCAFILCLFGFTIGYIGYYIVHYGLDSFMYGLKNALSGVE